MKGIIRPLGIPLAGEGVAMLTCLIPALHYGDGTWGAILVSGLATLLTGITLLVSLPRHKNDSSDNRAPYVIVTLVWIVMSLFGTLPFLTTHAVNNFSDAFFESISGLTSTGASILPDIEAMPPSVLLWRSITGWIGGFGIILLVLAVVPSLGMNKHSLYTAEVSGADNTGRSTAKMTATIQHTLSIYIALTLLFIIMLTASGMTLWEAVNLTFTNISTCGFSIYGDSIARFTPEQQYILAAAMFLGGVNFALLYNFFTLQWQQIRHKTDQFLLYVVLAVLGTLFTIAGLHEHNSYSWNEALRCGTVQTMSVLTTTGSVVADTTQWWIPVRFLFLILCTCGGMAGSTTGGVKVMRVLILFRNVRYTLNNRLHPHAVNPVRLNGKPVPGEIITNVMVIFVVYAVTMLAGFMLLMLSGVPATESIGAVFGCITSYGPGMGSCGGFGSYAAFPVAAKWICDALMLLGRLECMTVLILFLPGFWRRH